MRSLIFRQLLVAVVLAIAGAAASYGVDLAPPEVPNPYGTSEARAIRDHLEETFRIKASDKLSVEELRELYRKTWNADQEKRYLDENSARPADPAWVKAYTVEQEQFQRAKWVATLERLGVKAPADATIDQLRTLAAQAAREQEDAAEKKRKDETERLRAEVAKQNAAVTVEKPAGSPAKGRSSILLTPIFGEQEILTEAGIRGAVKVFTTMPSTTEVERAAIERKADGHISTRQAFIKNYNATAAATNGAGIEVWLGTKPNRSDKEKAFLYLLMVNMTPDMRFMNTFEVTFTGSKRNMTLSSDRHLDATIFPLNIREYYVGEYYVDEGQTIKVGNVSFR